MGVPELRRRFLVTAAVAWPAGGAVLLATAGWKTSAAFALTFLLVAGDFLWMALGVEQLLGAGAVPAGAARWFLMGLAFRSLLLLLGIYGIFSLLPRESLGVLLGIGGPLALMAAAGAASKRG